MIIRKEGSAHYEPAIVENYHYVTGIGDLFNEKVEYAKKICVPLCYKNYTDDWNQIWNKSIIDSECIQGDWFSCSIYAILTLWVYAISDWKYSE